MAIFWSGSFIFGFPGVMASYWQDLFQVGKGAVGNILFFLLASVGFFMFFVGRLQEKYGTRAMITIGAVLTGLDMFLIAHASSVFWLYLWAFLMGTASCFLYIPGLTTAQQWFPARRGLVAGIVNFTFGVSAALMAPLFGMLLGSLGYVAMNYALAIVALLMGVIAAQFTEGPQVAFSQNSATPGSAAPHALGPSLTVSESLKTTSFWFLWITWALQGAAGIAMVTLSTAFGLSRGFTLESAVIVLTAFNAANGTGRLVTGFLSDIIGRNFTMSVAFCAAGAAYFLLPYAQSLVVMATLAAVIGFAFGTLFGVSAPLATDCFGLEHFGAIFGLVFTAYGFISGVIGPSLAGYVLDHSNGNFFAVFGYLGVFCLLSGVFIRFVVPPHAAHKRG
jgi:OFA family oxalate/formate antiporter-like MFS transporter